MEKQGNCIKSFIVFSTLASIGTDFSLSKISVNTHCRDGIFSAPMGVSFRLTVMGILLSLTNTGTTFWRIVYKEDYHL